MAAGHLIKLLTIQIAVVGLPSAANASDWWHVHESGTAPGRAEQFVDRDSVQPSAAGNKLVMTMLVTEQPLAVGINALRGMYEIDCRKGRSRSVYRVAIDANGEPAGDVDREPLAWQRNPPGSFAFSVQQLACNGKLPADAFDIGGLDPQLVTRAYFDGDTGE